MKVVLHCGYYYPDTVGGTEAYVQMLGQDLQQRGHEVTVAAPSSEDEEQTYTHGGLSVYRYPVSQDPSQDEVQGRARPASVDTWTEWLAEADPDLVHMHSLTRGCSVHHAEAVTQRDIPLFITVHVPEVSCPRGTMMRWGTTPCDGEIRPVRCGACVLQQDGMPRPLAWATSAVSTTDVGRGIPGSLGTVLRRAPLVQRRKDVLQDWMGSAEHVVVVAGWLKEVLVRNDIPADHITVSRHGLSESMRATQQEAARKRPPRTKEDPLRVGFVGRFTEVKGPHVLVEAVRHLADDVNVEVHLYGMAQSDEDRAYLSDMKDSAAGEPRVQFCGTLTDANRIEAFASFDVLAVPSTWFETGPYTVLEAFAADLPVLGSSHGGIAERVDDGKSGMLVPPGDVEAWVGSLRQLYQRKRQGNWGWTLPTPRSSHTIAGEMTQMYFVETNEKRK
ncbi:glycosyltransferase [Salinibacter sp.]|uniref:glycosyltransferase n=1 Tax=Salinibacter sp. TaxID=2065818 RepID=UPI0021E93A38|nr:glycosyltransferase [Salinibacter sp.]